MSTKNIKDLEKLLDTADKAHEELEDNVLARAKELSDEQAAAEKKLADAERRAARAARARRRLFDDTTQVRDEEAGQLSEILADDNMSEPEPEPQAPVQPAPAPVDHDSDDAGNPPTAVTPVVVAPEPAPLPPNHVPWYRRIFSGTSRQKIGILILILIAVFVGTLLAWNWLSAHALGDQEFAQNNVLAFAIAALVTLGVGFYLWPEDEDNSPS